MGLDMYLCKNTYVWREDRDKLKISGLKAEIDTKKVSMIEEECGYWRKANAIHGWFVDNVQEGIDDGREAYVSMEKLEELLGLVKNVLANPDQASQILPVRAGDFFGNYDPVHGYDTLYFESMKKTQKILEEALKEKDANFFYQASW